MDTERAGEQSVAAAPAPSGRTLRRHPSALTRDIGSTLLVQIPAPVSASFDLSETGRYIWLLLDPPIDRGALVRLVIDETAATESDRPGIETFIDELIGIGAVEVVGTADAG